MIQDVKCAFKVLKYSYGIKTNIIFSLFYILYGAFCILAFDGLQPIGVLMFAISPMTVIQLVFFLNFSDYVGSSPMKKKLQTTIPGVLTEICQTIGYSVMALLLYTDFRIGKISEADLAEYLLIGGIAVLFMTVYMAVVYKHYWLALIVMMALMIGSISVLMTFSNMHGDDFSFPVSPVVSLIIGIVFTLLSGPVYTAVTKLLYKLPLCRIAMGAKLRNEM